MTAMPVELAALEPAPRATSGRRLLVLLGAIIVLSAADLAVTLTHLRTIGMIEANPVASWLIRTTQSPWSLVAFKALTVLSCVSLLYRLRGRQAAEVGAWLALLALVCLCVQWHAYTVRFVDDSEQLLLARNGSFAENWIVLD
jgi:uncharacterized membrane protein